MIMFEALNFLRQGVMFTRRLSVCLLATSRKATDCRNLHENSNRDVTSDKDELIKLLLNPALRILRHCKTAQFSTVWLLSLANLIGYS